MHLSIKSGFATAAILAASVGFAGLTKAAPLAGVAAAVPAMQMTQVPSGAEALPKKPITVGISIAGNPMSIENPPVIATTVTTPIIETICLT